MAESVFKYFKELGLLWGQGWNRFWFDPMAARGLAILRIAAGLVALYVYLSLWPDLQTWFGPKAWLGPEVSAAVAQEEGTAPGPSLWSWAHSSTAVQVLFLAGLIPLVTFTAGFFTRISNLLALIVVLSTNHALWAVALPVDSILAMLLAYLCLGRSGDEYSVDRWLAKRRAAGSLAAPKLSFWNTLATRLIMVHLAVCYFSMAISKLGPLPAGAEIRTGAESEQPWWTGSAVWWLAVRTESPLIDVTGLLADNETLTNLWTHAIVVLELAFALLIWYRTIRPLLLGLSIVHWLLLGAVTGQMPLALLMIAANSVFCDWSNNVQAAAQPGRGEFSVGKGRSRQVLAKGKGNA